MQAIAELRAPPEVLQALRDGRRSGQWIRARCPFCDPEGRKRRNLAASHTGFGRHRDRPGWVCHACHAEENLRQARTEALRVRYDPDRDRDDGRRRREAALRIIERSRLIERGDPVDRYLRGRGLRPTTATWPSSLRCAVLRHPQSKQQHPAMVAVVSDAGNMAVAVHRTFLTKDGRKASVSPVKMALGAVSGGAVRLGIDSDTIVVAEGIESALGAAMTTERVAWASLSAGNMTRLSLPGSIKRVIIAPDIDRNEIGMKAATQLRSKIKDLQRDIYVSILPPPRGRSDFADFG